MFVGFAVQTNVDKDQIKAAIAAQQDQQIDNVCTLSLSFFFFCVFFSMII